MESGLEDRNNIPVKKNATLVRKSLNGVRPSGVALR